MEKKFPILRIITVILKIIAWVVAALTIIAFFGLLIGGAALSQLGSRYGAPHMLGAFGGVAMAFYALIVGVIWFVGLLASAELILVVLAIEENTRTLKQQ